MIREIEIEDFKRIKKLHAVIPEDTKIILIEGDNSTGKSALFDAIGLLLTNTALEKMSTYIRWGAKKFRIAGKFFIKGKLFDYSLKVYGSSTPTERLLHVEGEDTPYTGAEAAARMAVAIDPTLATYSALSRQFQSAAIIEAKDSARLTRLKAVFGADLVDMAAAIGKERETELKTLITTHEATLKAKKESILQLQPMTEPVVPGNIEATKAQLSKYQALRKAYEAQKALFDGYQQAQAKWLEAQTELETTSQDLGDDEKKIENLKSQKADVPDYDRRTYSFLQKKIPSLQESIRDLTKKTSDARTVAEDFKTKTELVAAKTARLEELQVTADEVPVLEKDLAELRRDLLALGVEEADLQKQRLLAEAGKCSQCGQDWHGKDLKTIDDALDTASKDFALIEARIRSTEAKLVAARSAATQSLALQTDIQSLKRALAGIEADLVAKSTVDGWIVEKATQEQDLQEFQKTWTSVSEKFEAAQAAVEANKDIDQEIAQLQQRIAGNEARLEMLEQVKQPAAVTDPGVFTHDDDIQALQKTINVYDSLVEERDRVRAHNSKIAETKQAIETEVEELTAAIHQAERESEQLRRARLYLTNKFSAFLVKEGSQFVQKEMNRFFQKGFQHLQVVLEEGRQSVDFKYYGELGIKTPVSLAGGYEREFLSVAFRRATAILQGLPFLMLDEVDSASNETRSLQFYRLLVHDKALQQVVCITHKESTKEMLKNEARTYVIRLDDKVA